MKRMNRISAASNASIKFIPEAFSDLETVAESNGYTLDVDSNLNMTIIATADVEFMPTITVTTAIKNGTATFDTTMTFPPLDSTSMEYYDDIQHWLNKWSKVGNLITSVIKFKYDPTVYED